MAEDKKNKSPKFWGRWVRPRLPELLWRDSSFWISIAAGLILGIFPVASPAHLRCGISVESVSSSVVSFAAIGLGVSVALGGLVVTFPSGKLRRAMRTINPDKGRSPYSDLAFVAFWAGVSNLFAASVALVASIVAGPYKLFQDSSLVPAVAGALVLCSALYALLQMLAALKALLQAAGLSEAFDRPDK